MGVDLPAKGATNQIAAVIGIAIGGFVFSFFVTPSDFAQDYLAANAVLHRIDPNSLSSDLAGRFGVARTFLTSVQTAHPPFVTAIALPFATLPWPHGKLAWQIVLSVVTAGLLLRTRVSARDMLFLSPAWVYGLALGNIDPIVVCLCLIAIGETRTRPVVVALCLGAAIAMKVYPALLILGLFATRRTREAVGSAAVAILFTLAATGLIGFVSLTGWLRFIPGNGDTFAISMLNLSLSKVAALAGIPTIAVTLLGFVAAATLAPKRRMQALLPIILLVSPVAWLQLLPLISNLLTRRLRAICCVASTIIVVSWFYGVRWAAYIGVLASFTLTACIVVVCLRELKPPADTRVTPTSN